MYSSLEGTTVDIREKASLESRINRILKGGMITVTVYINDDRSSGTKMRVENVAFFNDKGTLLTLQEMDGISGRARSFLYYKRLGEKNQFHSVFMYSTTESLMVFGPGYYTMKWHRRPKKI